MFYATIAAVTVLALVLNFLKFNPMRALVWSGVVQGFSVPSLLLLMMLMTNDRWMMGERVRFGLNVDNIFEATYYENSYNAFWVGVGEPRRVTVSMTARF